MLHSTKEGFAYKNFTLKVKEETSKIQHDTIIEFIKDFFADKKGPAVIGISGGKDSTVCAALLAEALGPERVVGVMMPNGEQKDIADSHQVIEMLGIQAMKVNIGPVYDALRTQIDTSDIKDSPDQWTPLFTTNTPARLRMVTLYGIAAQLGGFVCNTCNASEDWVGYSTKWGDAVGDFSLLNYLTKTEVVALGDYMKLSAELIHKAPSDGMCGKTDEDNMGFTYEELDFYLHCPVGRGDEDKMRAVLSGDVIMKIEQMHNNINTKYKLVNMAKANNPVANAIEFVEA